MNDFYEIKDNIATLSTSGDYEIAVKLIEYNGKKEKIDIRKWNTKEDRMLKGISLTKEEAIELKNVLNAYLKDE